MQINFLDLSRQHREIEVELRAVVARVLSGGVFCLGPEVQSFEDEWAGFCHAKAAAAVGSGTDALSLTLTASGVVKRGSGDEVIVPTLTAGYTALAVLNAGAVPVFADIDPRTYTLDINSTEDAITPRTRAIVPVHLYGQLADISGICDVAKRHSIVVIEDAAQAHGASLDGKPLGSESLAATFSFYPTKNLGACGDGGAVVSNDLRLIERVKSLRVGGHSETLHQSTEGRNSRLDEIQAALLRVKLKHLTKWNHQRRRLASIYSEELQEVTDLRLPYVRLPEAHVFHLHVIAHPNRERLRNFLFKRGIETKIHYPFLLHQVKLFRRSVQKRLPIAESLSGRLLSLPLYPQLSENEIGEIASAIREFQL